MCDVKELRARWPEQTAVGIINVLLSFKTFSPVISAPLGCKQSGTGHQKTGFPQFFLTKNCGGPDSNKTKHQIRGAEYVDNLIKWLNRAIFLTLGVWITCG